MSLCQERLERGQPAVNHERGPSDIAGGWAGEEHDCRGELVGVTGPDEAHLILAALVGAIALARAVDDRALSDEILQRVARALHRGIDQGLEI